MIPERYAGVWWLPEDPKKRVAGTLTSTAQTLTLELLGSFQDEGSGLDAFIGARRPDKYPLVVGKSMNGRSITLQDCMNVSAQGGAGVTSQRLVAPMGFVGVEATAEEELRWRTAHVHFRHLSEWFGESSLDTDFDLDAAGKLLTYQLRYSRPDNLTADLGEDSVELSPSLRFVGRPFRAQTLEPTVYFRVSVPKPLPVSLIWRRFIVPLQDLVTLATTVACPVTEFRVSAEDEKVLPPSVEVLGPTTRHGNESEKALSRRDMLFTADAIKATFGEAVGRWLSGAEELRAPRSLFFTAQYSPDTSLSESGFLNLTQAAESFHRTRFPGLELPESQHEERVAAILSSAPSDHVKWLRDELRYSNELSFRRRLNDLYEYVEPVIQPLEPRQRGFVNAVVDARNDFVHLGRIAFGPSLSFERFFRLTESVRYMMAACFLQELGVDSGSAAELFQQNSRYKFAVGRASAR